MGAWDAEEVNSDENKHRDDSRKKVAQAGPKREKRANGPKEEEDIGALLAEFGVKTTKEAREGIKKTKMQTDCKKVREKPDDTVREKANESDQQYRMDDRSKGGREESDPHQETSVRAPEQVPSSVYDIKKGRGNGKGKYRNDHLGPARASKLGKKWLDFKPNFSQNKYLKTCNKLVNRHVFGDVF